MRIIIKRTYGERDKEILRKSIRRRFGRYEKIHRLLNIRKCTKPEIGEAFLYLYSIKNDLEIDEEIVVEDRKIFLALTPRRFEIVELINDRGPLSIKEIAMALGRDYKNVYDDIFALYRYFVINLVRLGKERMAVGKTERMEIRI